MRQDGVQRYTAEEAARFLLELPSNSDICGNEDELETDTLLLLINLIMSWKTDIQMRTTAYQLHRQGEGVVMLDLGVVVVEIEQGKQQQM